MEDNQETRFFTIEDVAAMSGLSTRTVRSYLSAGQLEGEKIDGAWRFTPEQFGAFLSQDMVRQSVQAKANAVVYDFLLTNRRREGAACLILDQPVSSGCGERELCRALEGAVNELGLRWAYRFENGMARSILAGPPEKLGALLTRLG